MEIVYLIHFSAPVRGASHYIGRTGQLEIRLAQHRKGQGARLTRLAVRAGLRLELAMAYLPRPGETSAQAERRLKRAGGVSLCPLCRAVAVPAPVPFPSILLAASLNAEM